MLASFSQLPLLLASETALIFWTWAWHSSILNISWFIWKFRLDCFTFDTQIFFWRARFKMLFILMHFFSWLSLIRPTRPLSQKLLQALDLILTYLLQFRQFPLARGLLRLLPSGSFLILPMVFQGADLARAIQSPSNFKISNCIWSEFGALILILTQDWNYILAHFMIIYFRHVLYMVEIRLVLKEQENRLIVFFR